MGTDKEVQLRFETLRTRSLVVIPSVHEVARHMLVKVNTTADMASAIWLLFLDASTALQDVFTDINVPFNCEFLVARPSGGSSFILTEVYRVAPSLSLHTPYFGYWTPGEGLHAPPASFYQRRSSLHGATLKVAVKSSPVLLVTQSLDGKEIEVGGIFGQVWRLLEKILHFKSDYISHENDSFGLLKEGAWTGVMGALTRNEVDASCLDFLMDSKRAEAIDFLNPILDSRTIVIVRKEDNFDTTWSSFSSPFSLGLWLATLTAMLVLAISLFFCQFSNKFSKKGRVTRRYSFGSVIFYIVSVFERQAQDLVLRCTSGHVVCLISQITSLVLFAGYSSFLTSYLTLRRTVVPFNNFQELLQDRSYSLGVTFHSSTYAFFRDNNDPVIQGVFNKLLKPTEDDLPRTHEEGVRRVCEGPKYAHVLPQEASSSLLRNATCDIIFVHGANIPGRRAMALVKHSPFRGLFKNNIQRMLETGILKELRQRYLSFVLQDENTPQPSVHIGNLIGVVNIWCAAIFISMVILVIERIWHRFGSKHLADRHENKMKINNNSDPVIDNIFSSK
ncbi:glutamate receptor-like [Periplaneta americana]|uniref:glutamate receptor-like n=1 Tax=Periplaneta americana TaxID=6978 RepID=UPI0037E8F92A